MSVEFQPGGHSILQDQGREYESFRLQFRSPALDRRIVQVKANWFFGRSNIRR
jgi:hypothetical protein